MALRTAAATLAKRAAFAAAPKVCFKSCQRIDGWLRIEAGGLEMTTGTRSPSCFPCAMAMVCHSHGMEEEGDPYKELCYEKHFSCRDPRAQQAEQVKCFYLKEAFASFSVIVHLHLLCGIGGF